MGQGAGGDEMGARKGLTVEMTQRKDSKEVRLCAHLGKRPRASSKPGSHGIMRRQVSEAEWKPCRSA